MAWPNSGWVLLVVVVALTEVALVSCAPSDDDLKHLVDERIKVALTAVLNPAPLPTATPQPVSEMISLALTAVPTATFIPTPTPQPTSTPHPVVDFSTVYQGASPSVFYIETFLGHGSGWLVEPGLILTNQHVVAGFSHVTVRQSTNKPFSAFVVATDSLRDIALLQFDIASATLDPKAAPLPIGDIPEEYIARSLLSLGYSDAGVKNDGTVGSAAANVGVLSQIVDFGPMGFGLNLMMDAPIDPGDSGGPVLNAEGFVVGMARAVRVQTSGGQRVVGTFYAIHAEEIQSALALLKNKLT